MIQKSVGSIIELPGMSKIQMIKNLACFRFFENRPTLKKFNQLATQSYHIKLLWFYWNTIDVQEVKFETDPGWDCPSLRLISLPTSTDLTKRVKSGFLIILQNCCGTGNRDWEQGPSIAASKKFDNLIFFNRWVDRI